MSERITYDKIMKAIKNLDVPYDSGFNTEEHMVASFQAGLLLAAKIVRAHGNIGFAEMLKAEAKIEGENG